MITDKKVLYVLLIIVLNLISIVCMLFYKPSHTHCKIFYANSPTIQTTCNYTVPVTASDSKKLKYIFDFDRWRSIFGKSINNMTMCDVPDQVRSIVDTYCRTALRRPCLKIPCELVYQSSKASSRVRFHVNGRIIMNDDQNTKNPSRKVEHIECIKSPAIDLFIHGPPYPSLRANGYDPITKDLFGDLLSRHYRSPGSIWGMSLNGESIGNYPLSGDKPILSFFDITQGYDRNLYDVVSDDYLLDEQRFFFPGLRVSFDSAISPKSEKPSYVTAPALWMNSNCAAVSKRSQYMKQLMTYMPVDSWGKCSRNKGPELPPELLKIDRSNQSGSHYETKWVLTKKTMMKHYLFTVAIENSFEHDYVTEKLWHPLAAGSVPLYYGAPNFNEWLPCDDCIIDLQKFPNPRAAAEYIMAVSNNATRYAEFHKWRLQPVLPRFQKILDYFKRANIYSVDSMVCAMAHSNNPQLTRYEILNDIGPMFNFEKKTFRNESK